MLKQTPLYQLHVELGGKMTVFAGYQLPIHYTNGIIHEHLHCRSHAGFFDISHMGQCLILGDKAVDAFERLTPSDIKGLQLGQQKYTVLTNSEGGIIDDIIVTRMESGLRVVVNAACKDKDFQYLSSQLSSCCRFEALADQALFALQGPLAKTIIAKFSLSAANLPFMTACEVKLDNVTCTISRSGYTGEDGFELSVANVHSEQLARLLLSETGVIPIGIGARDTLRLEVGLCLYGHELNETTTPVEAGLAWLVKKGKRDFPGENKIIQQLQQGVEKKRVGLIVDSKVPVREGSIVYCDEKDEIGHVTSGSFAPSLNKPIAMATIDSHYSVIGSHLYTKVRGRHVAVTVTHLPFIPHRYHK
jgi:aminomethyltransferase